MACCIFSQLYLDTQPPINMCELQLVVVKLSVCICVLEFNFIYTLKKNNRQVQNIQY